MMTTSFFLMNNLYEAASERSLFQYMSCLFPFGGCYNVASIYVQAKELLSGLGAAYEVSLSLDHPHALSRERTRAAPARARALSLPLSLPLSLGAARALSLSPALSPAPSFLSLSLARERSLFLCIHISSHISLMSHCR